MKKQYPGEPFNLRIQSLINNFQEKNWLIATKKGEGKLPIFCCNVYRLVTIYG